LIIGRLLRVVPHPRRASCAPHSIAPWLQGEPAAGAGEITAEDAFDICKSLFLTVSAIGHELSLWRRTAALRPISDLDLA
jgi:hypothetical protein